MFFKKKKAFDYAFEGEKLLLDKKYQKALKFYNNAISIAQKENFANIDLYFSSRATINKNLGKLKEALSDINKAIEIQPKVYLYYFERSEIKELLGDTEGVQTDLKTIYEILDKNGSSHMFKIYLAKKKLKQGKHKEAEEILDKNTQIYFDNEPVLLLKLKIHQETKNYQKIIEDTNKLIEIFPLRTMYYDIQTDAYLNLNQNEKALETVNAGLAIEPKNSHLLLMKAHAFFNLEDKENAVDTIKKCLSMNPSEIVRKSCHNFLITMRVKI